MIITKIYGKKTCHGCQAFKKKYPEAIYVDVDELSKEERDYIIELSIKNNLMTLPVMLDENDNVIPHKNGEIIE